MPLHKQPHGQPRSQDAGKGNPFAGRTRENPG